MGVLEFSPKIGIYFSIEIFPYHKDDFPVDCI